MTDSKFSKRGLKETDKQKPVSARKRALRDVQNEMRILVPKPMADSQTSGTKRASPEYSASPPHHQSLSSNGSAHLVYVRRKSEAKASKSSTSDSRRTSADGPCSSPHQPVETIQLETPTKANVSSYSTSAPLQAASLMNHTSLGKSPVRSPTIESNYVSSILSVPTRRKIQHWEERYVNLQMLLRKLDQSNQGDYIQMLRSLSPVDLSRHAVELEKKAIQLALEEAKEMERVLYLDVLQKATDYLKAQRTH